MAPSNCPFCGLKIVSLQSVPLQTETERKAFMKSICTRCWDAIMETAFPFEYAKPINEAEQLDGLR